MPPAEIADSDDDDNGSDSPFAPENNELITVSAQTRSSDRTSHATASTDPILFQTVFDEQREAAHQSALKDAFYPTGSERCHENTSSASIELLAAPDAWSSTNPGERQCSTTKRKTEGAAMVEAKDMWDVPSSPERNPGSSISRTKSRQATTIKITRGLRRNVEMLGYESDEDAGRTRRDTKRRKSQSSTDDDLDTPIKDKKSPNAVTISTMNIDDQQHPLCIATKPLSESQKEEYESVRGSQTNTMAKEASDSKRQHSSGTATNFNTPRVNDPSSHEEGGGLTQVKRRTRARRDSSPDVITLDRGGDEVQGCDASSQGDHVDMPSRRQDQQDDDESDFGESMVKERQKKKRGRPPKKMVASEPLKAKRGRPKKKKKKTEEQGGERALEETIATEDPKPPEETKKQDAALTTKTASPQPPPPPLSRNKPLYRVGLSKRLRIEPLLKSLPK
ncbi:hypothetical protein L249_6128 [Ophiocordyceps polyrhachis-furcata BCC 54312]|uniref:Uncharacterized protein n=1 Tax=Ophiocordyceps polyrhachis-furcata BCC 54312 TaxID=1330021 RepID=A0A367LJ69_9HYPO|nr:hypothetical protein L249_6128 [Ophiocordyceps polyrhachis-furcata BCC 54312]